MLSDFESVNLRRAIERVALDHLLLLDKLEDVQRSLSYLQMRIDAVDATVSEVSPDADPV